MTEPKKWVLFYLDISSYYGLIENQATWEKVVGSDQEKLELLLRLNSNSFPSLPYPDFGKGAKYTASPTLGEWAEAEGMDLSV
jgi:hypothetical protein